MLGDNHFQNIHFGTYIIEYTVGNLVVNIRHGSAVVDSMFYVPPIVCGGSVFGLYFVMHYLVSFLVLPFFTKFKAFRDRIVKN